MLRKRRGWLLGTIAVIFLLSAAACSQSEPEVVNGPKSPLELFAGNHARVAWVQDQGDGSDSFAFGQNLVLMGFDSRDGNGERKLLDEKSNFYKPIFSPDGNYVIVSDRVDHQIYKVDFKTGKKVPLGDGVAVAVWKEPGKDRVWVYALAGDGHENKYLSQKPLVRFKLNKPKKRELVWNKTHLSWSNLDISSDGKMIGGLFPWPHASVLNLDDGRLTRVGKGCWTSLSPDNNKILWIFDGPHRNLNFVQPATGKKWTTNINAGPEMDGYEVYHPRWSNHFNYFAVTGPYVEGEGGNKIGGGGQKVEVYLGKFSNDLKEVSSWHKVTDNDFADFYPDLWVAESVGSGEVFGKAEPRDTKPLVLSDKWPASIEKMGFVWETSQSDNQLPESSPVGFFQGEVVPAGRAIFNRFSEMNLRTDGFVAKLDDKKIWDALQTSNYFGLELLFTPDSVSQTGNVLQHVGVSRTLALTQNGDTLELTTNGKGMVPLITAEKSLHKQAAVHLFIEVTPKEVQLYMNGKLVGKKEVESSLIESFEKGELTFGNDKADKKGIEGAVSHVGVYLSPITSDEIIHNAQLVTGALEERVVVEPIRLEGELVEQSQIPAPDSLGAYSRALTVDKYKVTNVLQGEYNEQEIVIARWAVLDRKIVEEVSVNKVGQKDVLTVEKFDDHPELEGERLMMDLFEPDLDMFYLMD